MHNTLTEEAMAQVVKDQYELSAPYLCPGQICERLAKTPVVYLAVAPLEWHGPHNPFGTDPLDAQAVALAVCRRVGGVVWPTLFMGTERERPEDELRYLGLKPGQYVVGMDFSPKNLPSAYCPEEILVITVREIIQEAKRIGAKLVVVVNGHGATNQVAALKRLEIELNATGGPKVLVAISEPKIPPFPDHTGHAASIETSRMMLLSKSVDLSQLPPLAVPLKYSEYSIVDHFDGKGLPDCIVSKTADPRLMASVEKGKVVHDAAVADISVEVLEKLKNIQ